MKILVIGGTGFIGAPSVRRLARQHEVTVMHRGPTRDLPASVRHLFRDRAELPALRNELAESRFDVVLDVIPYRESEARLLMDAFRGTAQRVVAISSQDVYRNYGILRGLESGPPAETAVDETAALRSVLYPYRERVSAPGELAHDYDKIPVERVVMSEPDSLPGTVLRLPAVYGEGDPHHRLARFLDPMRRDEEQILIGEDEASWRWTHGYVENVADAIALAVVDARATNRIYNVGEENPWTIAEWIRNIAETVGWRGELVVAPAATRRPDLVADTRRLREELGYAERIGRVEALGRTIFEDG